MQTKARPPRFFHLVATARQNLMRSADRQFAEQIGVSGTQVGALFAVKSQEGSQLKDLAATLQLKNAAVTGLVQRMAENGLLERHASEHDGRAGRLQITPRGHEVLDAARPVLARLNQQLTAGFSDEELAVVVRFLEHASALRFEPASSP